MQKGAPSMIIFAAKNIHSTYTAQSNSKLSYLGTDNNMVLHYSFNLNLKQLNISLQEASLKTYRYQRNKTSHLISLFLQNL